MTATTIEAELTLLDSIKRGDADAVAALLAAGTDPDALDPIEGCPALQIASARGHLAIARLLLEHGAQPLEPAPGEPPAPQETAEPVSPAAPRTEGPSPGAGGWAPALLRLYHERGYIKRPRGGGLDHGLGQDEDWEVRFIHRDKRSLGQLRAVLALAGFIFGPAERRFGHHMQIVPGREAVKRVMTLLADDRRQRGPQPSPARPRPEEQEKTRSMNPWRWVDPRVSSIRLGAIRAYLEMHGYSQKPSANPTLLRFEADARQNGTGHFFVLPASESAADYVQAITYLLTTLSELEDRHPVAIVEEILRRQAARP
jgi:hypothetical protein